MYLNELPKNPYFSVTDETLTIHCHKKTVVLKIAEIKNMYQENANYWHQIVGYDWQRPATCMTCILRPKAAGFAHHQSA
jgi:hypothetical protein